jgi:uncharacterized protein (TIGR00725 family)
MTATYSLDRATKTLSDAAGRCFDPARRTWTTAVSPAPGVALDTVAATTWLQRESGYAVRVPIGVIGPRDASGPQIAAATAVGRGLAQMGFVVICGGREGVMEAVCKGAAEMGGTTIGLLPDVEPSLANPYVSVVIATGIGEARNALIARSALCLIAIGNSFGTLSEVALGRQFGKLVIGLEGAPPVGGVRQAACVVDALRLVAEYALNGTCSMQDEKR